MNNTVLKIKDQYQSKQISERTRGSVRPVEFLYLFDSKCEVNFMCGYARIYFLGTFIWRFIRRSDVHDSITVDSVFVWV